MDLTLNQCQYYIAFADAIIKTELQDNGIEILYILDTIPLFHCNLKEND